MTHPIQHLAAKCAHANLSLKEARMLFEAMYLTDALMLSGGNSTKAARRMGIERGHVARKVRRGSDWDNGKTA